MSDSDDDWGDEKQVEVPAYIMVGRVKEDYYPETHKHLTLFAGAPRDCHVDVLLTASTGELVYVFKKSSDEGPGWWEVRSPIFPL